MTTSFKRDLPANTLRYCNFKSYTEYTFFEKTISKLSLCNLCSSCTNTDKKAIYRGAVPCDVLIVTAQPDTQSAATAYPLTDRLYLPLTTLLDNQQILYGITQLALCKGSEADLQTMQANCLDNFKTIISYAKPAIIFFLDKESFESYILRIAEFRSLREELNIFWDLAEIEPPPSNVKSSKYATWRRKLFKALESLDKQQTSPEETE